MSKKISSKILQSVEKPSRYTGNEWNIMHKDLSAIDIRFAFCFPDVYEIGMSHLGLKILYNVLNLRKDTYCERVFAPWIDMEYQMRKNQIPLFSLETKEPLSNFNFIGFTLQYEMSYTNIINMLDLANLPILSSDRGEDHPIICAGGPCACNPEPLADIVDFFVIGEGEEVINEVLDLYPHFNSDKDGFLSAISKLEGIYVPKFYHIEYFPDNTIRHIINVKNDNPQKKIRKRIVKNLDISPFPEKMIVPFTNIVHDRIMLEIFRGCTRGCRFCQAGFIYRPVRERSYEKLFALAQALENSTGYEEISLVSLSTSDYSHISELASCLIDEMSPKKVNISLPSLRVDSFSEELMSKAQSVRKGGLTFAPEAGTQRLRNVINKGITEEDILSSAKVAFSGGWNTLKFYFMIGLPTETYADIEGICDLANRVLKNYKKEQAKSSQKRGRFNLTISVSSFVPKPFTPFQWEAQDSMDVLKEKQQIIKNGLHQITYRWHDAETSFLEGVLARGDRRIGKVLIQAWKNGCRFDGWKEHLKFDLWMNAFEKSGVDPKFYANRKRNPDEILPWDHIDIGVNKEFLLNENKKAYKETSSPSCREKCGLCGVNKLVGGVCFG